MTTKGIIVAASLTALAGVGYAAGATVTAVKMGRHQSQRETLKSTELSCVDKCVAGHLGGAQWLQMERKPAVVAGRPGFEATATFDVWTKEANPAKNCTEANPCLQIPANVKAR